MFEMSYNSTICVVSYISLNEIKCFGHSNLPLLFSVKQINLHKNWRKHWKEEYLRKRESNNHLFPQEWSGGAGKGTQTIPGMDKATTPVLRYLLIELCNMTNISYPDIGHFF